MPSKILIYFALLFAVSCAEPTDMVTVINPDGSCYREFSSKVVPGFLTGDSIKNSNPFPVDIDSTCQIRWKYLNSEWLTQFPVSESTLDSIVRNVRRERQPDSKGEQKSDVFCVQVRKNYSSVEELAANFRLKKSHEWSSMKVKYELEKKFRWFYTYYSYREIYPRIKTNFEIPVEKYLTNDEAKFWFTGQPDILLGMNGIESREYLGRVEDLYNKWIAHNLWNASFKVLLANYNQVDNQPVSKEKLKLLRDSIFNLKVHEPDFRMNDVLNDFFKTNAFTVLWQNEHSPMKKFEDDFNNQEFMSYIPTTFNYKLILPGKVIQPTTGILHGDTLVWKLTGYRMIPADYVIEAQSRKANVWAFILTGIILIVAVGSFLWRPKNRN